METEKAAIVGPHSGDNTGPEASGRTGDLPCMNEEGHPFEVAFRGEYRSRTGDLLHAMQAL